MGSKGNRDLRGDVDTRIYADRVNCKSHSKARSIRIRGVSLTSVIERVPREGIVRLVPCREVGVRVGVHVSKRWSV